MRRINILHLRASNFVGGPEKQLLSHFKHIDPDKYHLFLGSFLERNRPNELINEARRSDIDCIQLKSKLPFSPLLIFKLKNELKRHEIDILCTHGYKPNIIGYWASRLAGCAHIAFSRGFTAEDFKVRIYEWLDRIFLRRTENIVAVSQAHANQLVQSGINGARVTVVHNCIDTNEFRRSAQGTEGKAFKGEFQIADDEPVVTAVGRLSVEKGHIFLLKAAKMVISQYPKVKFIIVGEGPTKTHLIKWARTKLPEKTVIFTGFRKDVASIMLASTLIVNPSLTEACPNVILEAFAMEKPVVASDVGGVVEIVIPGKTGFLYPCRSYQALAERIIYCLENPEEAREMAQAGHQLVKKEFTFENQAEKLAALYEKPLSKAGGARTF